MPFLDSHAAATLRDLRERRGLSPEALSDEIGLQATREGFGARGTVDAHTIRRIERTGHVPMPRVRFVLAHYFALQPHEVWRPDHRIEVATPRRHRRREVAVA